MIDPVNDQFSANCLLRLRCTDFDAGYTQEQIDECDASLSEFLANAQEHCGAVESVLLNDVKTVVLALNELNEHCEQAIIETDQREEICALIDDAVKQAGLVFDHDLTEPWRQW